VSVITDGVVCLRALTRTDVPFLQEWDRRSVIDQPFNYFPDSPARLGAKPADRREFVNDRNRLIATLPDGIRIGDVSWHPVSYGPNARSTAYNIGIGLQPEHRRQGYGARVQRLLAAHLFATTEVNRVEASTDIDNVAEQRALVNAGFTREGVLRGAQFRAGEFRDLVVFSRLRAD
jgi:RimJ/RimL family protein N-acetyltransferase